MDSLPLDDNAGHLPGSARALRRRQLLDLLLSDAANDVEVVSRELGLRAQMRGRLRTALDRIACAQSVLESIGADGAEAGMNGSAADLRMRESHQLARFHVLSTWTVGEVRKREGAAASRVAVRISAMVISRFGERDQYGSWCCAVREL